MVFSKRKHRVNRSNNSLMLRGGLSLELGDLTSNLYFSFSYLDHEFKDCFPVSEVDVLTLVYGCYWVGLSSAPSVQCFHYINIYIVLGTRIRTRHPKWVSYQVACKLLSLFLSKESGFFSLILRVLLKLKCEPGMQGFWSRWFCKCPPAQDRDLAGEIIFQCQFWRSL